MNLYRNLPLRWKLLSTFALVLVIMIGLSIFAYRTTTSSHETEQWVEHTHEVIGLANEALAALVNMETGYRGFLVTGKDEFLEPYNGGKITHKTKLQELQNKTADNPTQVQRWRDIEQRAAAWQASITDPGMKLRRDVDNGTATTQDVINFETSGEGKRHFDGMRTVLTAAIGTEETLMTDRKNANAAARNRLLQALIWGTLGAVVLGLAIAYLLARSLTNSITQIRDASMDMAHGKTDIQLAIESQDEIGELSKAFGQMGENIRGLVAEMDTLAQAAVAGKLDTRRAIMKVFTNR